MTRKTRSKEYFSEAQYGVKASPRVSNLRTRLPRGGGRDQLGRPYKVAGKWYYPKEDRHYRKVGAASWYGDAFHGRLTANGEVYDMTHLTAAHPTMPLPSYARVTNLKNGSSVIVRVNDRGPYARGRIIDLSKRAAEMLDYAHGGVAKVKVEYVGRAPLDGHDDSYLMASYRPGKGTADPSDGLATGVMVAMNGPSPSRAAAAAMPGVLADSTFTSNDQPDAYRADAATPVAFAPGDVSACRPLARSARSGPNSGSSRAEPAGGDGPDGLCRPPRESGSGIRRVRRCRRRGRGQSPHRGSTRIPRRRDGDASYVAAGTFADRLEADRIAAVLAKSGRVSVEKSQDAEGVWYSVEVRSDGRRSLDDILEAAWMNGASDAITVRD